MSTAEKRVLLEAEQCVDFPLQQQKKRPNIFERVRAVKNHGSSLWSSHPLDTELLYSNVLISSHKTFPFQRVASTHTCKSKLRSECSVVRFAASPPFAAERF